MSIRRGGFQTRPVLFKMRIAEHPRCRHKVHLYEIDGAMSANGDKCT